MSETSDTGAKRDNLHPKADNGIYPSFPMRIGLIFNNDVGMRRLAQTYGEGAIKYGDKNWMNGFKETELLDHAMEHVRAFVAGDRSEDHLAHAVWNLFTLMWVEEKKPELMNLSGQGNVGREFVRIIQVPKPDICNVAKDENLVCAGCVPARTFIATKEDFNLCTCGHARSLHIKFTP